MNANFWIAAIDALPQGRLSRLWGGLARWRRPRPAIRLLKRGYARLVGMDMAEAEQGVDAYPNLEELFVRQLRPGLRPIDADPQTIVSPVDGRMGQCGRVEQDGMLQLKGRPYRLSELLGSAIDAARFEGGHYFTLYLAPPDYHRVHAPLAGKVSRSVLIPGRLRPVFFRALEHFDRLYARNERLITYMDTAAGPLAVIKVGATLVGRIRLAYDPQVWSNRAAAPTSPITHYDPPCALDKGDELGAFELGSTVVLVFAKDRVEPLELNFGSRVRMGEAIARRTAAKLD